MAEILKSHNKGNIFVTNSKFLLLLQNSSLYYKVSTRFHLKLILLINHSIPQFPTMLENISIDTPQLIVLPQHNYHCISKEFKDVLSEIFLWSYLPQKFADYSIRHYTLNEQIQEIFLTHALLEKVRKNQDIYNIDDKHYRQIFLTDTVCKSVSLIVAELFNCIYVMKNLQLHNQLPEKIETKLAIEFAFTNESLKGYLNDFMEFLSQSEAIRLSYELNFLRSASDLILIDSEPVYFVTHKNGTFHKYSLRKFIDNYNLFFTTCLNVLRDHSPKALASGLNKWSY